MTSSSLAKAKIFRLDKSGNPVPGKSVECMFNPKEYTFDKQNTWEPNKSSGSNMQNLTFKSGQPATLKVQLFFDTYAQGEDVREKYTDHLWALMLVDPATIDPKTKKGHPPKVRFQWGKTWSFDAVITALSQKFVLFLDDGTPVRATVDVTFQQVKDTEKLRAQNPTSGGEGGERVWRVSSGDTLDWIAYKEYGDSNKWRRIAAANGLADVRRLTPGMELVIPND